jgi:hypothetical protein
MKKPQTELGFPEDGGVGSSGGLRREPSCSEEQPGRFPSPDQNLKVVLMTPPKVSSTPSLPIQKKAGVTLMLSVTWNLYQSS